MDIEARVIEVIEEEFGPYNEAIVSSDTPAELGFDSIDVTELIIALEEEFDVELLDTDISLTDSVWSISETVNKRLGA